MSTAVHTERPITTRSRARRHTAAAAPVRYPRRRASLTRVLDSYLDAHGRMREVIERDGRGGSMLVFDRDVATRGDRRLLAHLAADEPRENAALLCAAYMQKPDASRCRRVQRDDLQAIPLGEIDAIAAEAAIEANLAADGASSRTKARPSTSVAGGCVSAAASAVSAAAGDASAAGRDACATELRCRRGEAFALLPRKARTSIPELRWCMSVRESPPATVSLREVVGRLESYDPARTLTACAIVAHLADPDISVATIAVELERLNASRTALNRGLREAVLARVGAGELSMSEIALRCGRVKRDRRGIVSGETSWLARRIGLAPDSPGCAPTPWVHSDVLALIARDGLAVSPREVELT